VRHDYEAQAYVETFECGDETGFVVVVDVLVCYAGLCIFWLTASENCEVVFTGGDWGA
jgi:hypothetical protein